MTHYNFEVHKHQHYIYQYFCPRFRALARLDNKYDETMMDYYVAFIAMCKRASGLELTEEEGRRFTLCHVGREQLHFLAHPLSYDSG